MSHPKWLPAGATKYRETDDFCIWDQVDTRDKERVRTVRRRKYLCIGGNLHGQRVCTNQAGRSYTQYNRSGGSSKEFSMVLISDDMFRISSLRELAEKDFTLDMTEDMIVAACTALRGKKVHADGAIHRIIMNDKQLKDGGFWVLVVNSAAIEPKERLRAFTTEQAALTMRVLRGLGDH